MIESLKLALQEWNKNTNERQKLQHTYIVALIVLTLVAGLISLTNADLGHSVVKVAMFSGAVYLANAVMWSFLSGSVLVRLTKPAPRVSKRR